MGNSNKRQNQTTGKEKDENAQAQNSENQTPSANAENPQGSEPENANVQPVNATSSDSQPETNQQPDTPAPTDKEKDELSLTDDVGKKAGDVQEKKMVKMVLKHKSHTPHYHRCGLTLTQVFAEYEVPEESVDKIKADKWIVVKDEK